jgi:hypothetical protein
MSIILVVVVSLLTQKKDPPRPLQDVSGKYMEFKNRLGINSLRDALRPLRKEEIEAEADKEAEESEAKKVKIL